MTATRPFKLLFSIVLMLATSFIPPVQAQQLLTDSAFYKKSTVKLFQSYKQDMNPDNQLYNGQEYLRPGHGIKGNPFFLSDSLLAGEIIYNNALFTDIELQYDLVSDDLIIETPTQSASLKLIKEKVSRFSTLRHNFLFLDPGNKTTTSMKPGFYEQLYGTGQDAVALYLRHEKEISLPANAEEQPIYKQSDSYYLKLNNIFYRIENKAALLNALKDKKNLLKKYIAENQIDFRKDFEKALIKTVGFYAQLKP